LLVLGMTSTAGATLSLVPDSLLLHPHGQPGVIQVVSDAPGGYGCWIGIEDLFVAEYDGDPTFTALGNPNGDSIMPRYDAHWYGEIIVSSLDPGNPILLTLLDSAVIWFPEPTTIALLALGGLFLLRRRK
ncbi:MAG: PEP-CTERM sorting domain-containing protein, partial [Planctomycetota bacterium]